MYSSIHVGIMQPHRPVPYQHFIQNQVIVLCAFDCMSALYESERHSNISVAGLTWDWEEGGGNTWVRDALPELIHIQNFKTAAHSLMSTNAATFQ